MITEKPQHPECPFVVGERYKNRQGDGPYVFLCLNPVNGRAIFAFSTGGLVQRKPTGEDLDGADCYSILPDPLPRVKFSNRYHIGSEGSEVWYVYNDKDHAEMVAGKSALGKLYAIAEPVEVPRG